MNQIPAISVIVPVHNKDRHLVKNLAPLQRDPRIEVIMVEAEQVSETNRAQQMNLGACQARAQTLVFLHIDTLIQLKDLWIIYQKLKEDPSLIGGAFRFQLDRQHLRARLIQWGVRLRERFFKLPYGDQSIFIRRDVFQEIGGYSDVPILEDVLLIQAMRKRGELLFYPRPAITSARRWERHGYLKTTLVNWLTMIFWQLGVSLERIVNFRRRVFHDPVRGDVKKEPARNQTEAA